VFNETLKAIMDVKYVAPMGIVDYCVLVLMGLVGLVVLQLLYKLLKKLFLKWQSRVDRSYNVFDRPELNAMEKQALKGWKFSIPPPMQKKSGIEHTILEKNGDHEVIVEFKHTKEDGIKIFKTAGIIP
jgi:hypothetical protein